MITKLSESVTHNPWQLRKRVLPQHTDHAGVVWHGTYVAWFEEARVEALVQAGLAYADLAGTGVEMPVVSLQINYFKSLGHGDLVVLESVCGERVGVRWPWFCRLMRGKELIAESFVELVLVQQTASGHRVLRRPPNELASVLNRLHAGPPRGML